MYRQGQKWIFLEEFSHFISHLLVDFDYFGTASGAASVILASNYTIRRSAIYPKNLGNSNKVSSIFSCVNYTSPVIC